MKKIGLFVRDDEKSKIIAEKIKNDISKIGFINDDTNPDIVIFVGGDGTLLRAVHHYLEKIDDLTFVGVRTGTLGFFCDYNEDELNNLYTRIKDNKEPKEYPLIEAEIVGSNKINRVFAVNEIRIENPFHTLSTGIYIDNRLMYMFNGNGLNVSSQLGSSAYNRSIGGALIERGLRVFQIQEIAPLSNINYRPMASPLVLDSKHKITFKPVDSKSLIGYDHLVLTLDHDYEITIFESEKVLKLIHNENKDYFEVLNSTFVKK